MILFIKNWLINRGINETLSLFSSNIIAIAVVLIVSFIINILVKKILLKALKMAIKKSKNVWDDILVEKKVFDILARVSPPLVIYTLAPIFPSYQSWIQRIAFSYMVFIVLLATDKFLDGIDDIYRTYEISKTRPIKGYLQVVKIFLYVMVIILIIGIIINRSPWVLLSGIGAATAVLLLIFQNSILGFVASIQLTSNNMIKLGDWIEMSEHGADGDVIDISIHTVKVQNWDKTITTIPTNALISKSFRNWSGMQQSGGRRIKRAIHLDMTSIKFCDEEMLERFSKIQYIKDYLEHKIQEINHYNKVNDTDLSSIVNGRHLTNIGTFRAYVEQYLKNHPKVNKDMLYIVRQLQSTDKGLPMEIYVFTNDTAWVNFEGAQSDIFDHIMAVVSEFDLRIYQSPTGYDLKTLSNTRV